MSARIPELGTLIRVLLHGISEPGDDEVLIKVVVSGSNPKDWKGE